jgi:hypothetical protein
MRGWAGFLSQDVSTSGCDAKYWVATERRRLSGESFAVDMICAGASDSLNGRVSGAGIHALELNKRIAMFHLTIPSGRFALPMRCTCIDPFARGLVSVTTRVLMPAL